jgi:hypothetical protein
VCGDPSSRLTIAGNLSACLSAAGNWAGVLTLEHAWDTLTRDRPFVTVCGYATSCFSDQRSEDWSTIAGEHSAVCVGSGV